MSLPESHAYSHAEGGVVAPRGFLCAGVSCGLKKNGKRDLALIAATHDAVPAAAVFTTNAVAAAPVLVSRAHIAGGMCRAVVINAGNANACTGPAGMESAELMANTTADVLGCAPTEVVVCSTGVIGVTLPVDRVIDGIAEAAGALDDNTGDPAAEAIMTTDTFAKQIALGLKVGGVAVTVGGMAKGSGMIAPNMATMLGVITTDAPLTSDACAAALRRATDLTFNRVTVDSDTSTNDTLVLMASGAADLEPIGTESEHYAAVYAAIETVAAELAKMLARDGEGATKLVTITVTGAASDEDALLAARTVADSPLVKTALFGRDANWGRVAAAVGRSGARVDADRLAIVFAGIEVCAAGTAVPFDEEAALMALGEPEVCVEIDLGLGQGRATVLTCDLTYEYVRINGEYRS